MRRRGAERLAELIDDPETQAPRSVEDRDFVRLAGISRELATVGRVQPDPRFVAGLRVVLLATAAQATPGACSERRTLRSFKSRLHLWIVAALTAGVVTVAGVSFASDSIDRPSATPTLGPVAPTAAPASSGGGGRSSATPGAGRSATPGAAPSAKPRSPGGVVGPSAGPSASQGQPSPGPSPSPTGGLVGGLLDLIGSLLP